jgi:hypothetical protein
MTKRLYAPTVRLSLVLCLAITSQACNAPPSRVTSSSNSVAAPLRNQPAAEPGQDTIAVRHYLRAQGYRLIEVAAHEGSNYAAIAEHTSSGARKLLMLSVRDNTVTPLHPPLDLGEYAPSLVQWHRLSGGRTDAVAVTFDYPEVAEVGTLVLTAQGQGLVRSYVDADPTCKPAEVRDLDGDGRGELLSYTGDPSGGDCATECHLALRERFNFAPAWVQVYSWSGQSWEPAAEKYPEFYRQLANRYEEVATWVEEQSGAACENVYWLNEGSSIRHWAARARVISGAP